MLPLLLTTALTLAAEPSEKLVGNGITGGQAKVVVTVTALEDERRLVEVHWPEYARTTLEAVTDTGTDCAADDLAEGVKRVGTPVRCLNARLPDKHPVYEYDDKTRVRCVFGEREGASIAACKLQYTGWFDLRSPDPE